jgi:hypothetical protein
MHIAFNELSTGVKPDGPAIWLDSYAVLDFRLTLQEIETALDLIGKDIRERDELNPGVSHERVVRGARSAASAADETDANNVAPRAIGPWA